MSAPDPDSASIVLSRGHVDVLAMSYDCRAGGITLASRDDSAGLGDPVFRSVEDTLIHASVEATMLTLPEGFEFLGPAGDPIYIFPETFTDTMVWPGWDSAGVAPGVFDGDELTLTLNSVEGPGDFIGYVFADVPVIVFDTKTGIDRASVAASTHTHLNWAFTSPGLYVLSFTVEASRSGAVTATNARARFFIGDLVDLPETEPAVIAIEGLSAGYELGDVLALRAVRYGVPVSFETRWLQQCPIDAIGGNFEVTAWEAVGAGAALEHVLVEGDQACQYRAVLFDELGVEHATSQTVNPAIAWPEG